MELGYLPGLFSHALQVATAVAPAAAAGDVDASNTAAAAIGLMGAILNWDFKGSSLLPSAMAGGQLQTPVSDGSFAQDDFLHPIAGDARRGELCSGGYVLACLDEHASWGTGGSAPCHCHLQGDTGMHCKGG